EFNRQISQYRNKIERTFGSIRRWFHGGRCRYRGLAKTHAQNILEAILDSLINDEIAIFILSLYD
ncbi:transposase, partial [Porphyromonas somerae]|uniref:transposase n=1 Tax=Porphyromonas somerae TaxID=322095 RepID=UPI002A75464C